MIGAIILSLSPRVAAALWPSILFAQITPKVAIAPLLLVWLGFGPLPKIVIAFLISFFPILANAYAGLQSIDTETEELARSMHASRLRYFLSFKLPHSLPRILSGARIAITFAIVGAIVAEFVGSDAGLGYLVILAARTLDSSLMLCSIVVLAVLGIGFYGVIVLGERLLIPWHVSRRRAALRELAETRAVAGGL
jgi:NitT/TauT family transport system permease protein